jgi:hypothetical protein
MKSRKSVSSTSSCVSGLIEERRVNPADDLISLPYLAVGFDITAFEDDPNEPTTAAGPGTLEFTFADATSFATDIFGNPAGDPIFVGITSDTAITGIRWSEPLEKGGAGNEETSLDNFSVSRVPEPGLALSLGAGLAGIAARRRRPPARAPRAGLPRRSRGMPRAPGSRPPSF